MVWRIISMILDPKKQISSRLSGDQLMISTLILFYGVSEVMIIRGHQDASIYFEILDNSLLPFAEEMYEEQTLWVFMNDNALIHTFVQTWSWLSIHSVRTIPWPANNRVMKIIENVWGILAGSVYSRGMQSDGLDELEELVCEFWSIISEDLLQKLYRSMYRGLLAVINSRGGPIKYWIYL